MLISDESHYQVWKGLKVTSRTIKAMDQLNFCLKGLTMCRSYPVNFCSKRFGGVKSHYQTNKPSKHLFERCNQMLLAIAYS